MYPFLMYRSIHPKHTSIQVALLQNSAMEPPGVVKVGYLTMWNRPIYEVLGCWLWFSILTVVHKWMSKTKIYGMYWDVHHWVTPCCAGHILSTLQCEAVALFLIQTCVFGGRHWSSKNASKSCCLVMKGELGSPICRCPKRVGGILFIIFQHCNFP